MFSGFHIRNDGVRLAEFIELQSNNFFIATQAHPEFNSRLGAASPLFKGFVDSAKKYLEAKQDNFFKIKPKENSQLIKI